MAFSLSFRSRAMRARYSRAIRDSEVRLYFDLTSPKAFSAAANRSVSVANLSLASAGAALPTGAA